MNMFPIHEASKHQESVVPRIIFKYKLVIAMCNLVKHRLVNICSCHNFLFLLYF